MVKPEAEIAFADGVPIVPNVRPVIIVSGTDYEMGYQWFQQYAHIFGKWILEEMKKSLTKEEIGCLEQHHVYVKNNIPEFIDIMRGMAKAAVDMGVHLSYAEVMAEFFPPKKFPDGFSGDNIEGLPYECSGFAAWGSTTTDGQLICLGIPDAKEIKFEHTVMVFPKDKSSNNFIVAPTYKEKKKPYRAWLPLHPGMNNKGLAYAHHGGGTNGRERLGWCMKGADPSDSESHGVYGEPVPFAVMHTLRYAQNAEEALKMSLEFNSWQKGLWADTCGDAFVLECRDPITVRRAGDYGETDFLYATNNVLSKGEIEKYLPEGAKYVPHGGWIASSPGYASLVSSIDRNLQMWNMFHNYQGKVDLEFAKMTARFAGNPPAYATLEEADASYGVNLGRGWDGTIGALSNSHVGIMLPNNGNDGLYHSCFFRAGRVAYPFEPKLFYYPVAPTHTFYQLKLTDGPAGVIKAAMDRARYDLYYANQELRKLTYWDVPYAPLDAIFNKAATEWTKGNYYQNLAEDTQGNECMCQYGKALRAFTRCQAYANQVYEALVPPPVTPTDLGLGKWETRNG